MLFVVLGCSYCGAFETYTSGSEMVICSWAGGRVLRPGKALEALVAACSRNGHMREV